MKCQRSANCRCSDVLGRVSLLLCWDVFVCGTYLGHNYIAE